MRCVPLGCQHRSNEDNRTFESLCTATSKSDLFQRFSQMYHLLLVLVVVFKWIFSHPTDHSIAWFTRVTAPTPQTVSTAYSRYYTWLALYDRNILLQWSKGLSLNSYILVHIGVSVYAVVLVPDQTIAKIHQLPIILGAIGHLSRRIEDKRKVRQVVIYLHHLSIACGYGFMHYYHVCARCGICGVI